MEIRWKGPEWSTERKKYGKFTISSIATEHKCLIHVISVSEIEKGKSLHLNSKFDFSKTDERGHTVDSKSATNQTTKYSHTGFRKLLKTKNKKILKEREKGCHSKTDSLK